MAFIDVGPLVVHYELSGPPGGPPVVLVNGLGTSLEVWDRQREALESRFRVLRYDLRGHGLTAAPAPGSELTVELLAEDALGLLDRLGIQRAHWCGLSIGGLVAQHIAAAAPARVERLVLASTASRIGTAGLWSERIEAVRRGGLTAIADGVLSRWFTAELPRRDPAIAAGMRTMLLATSADGYLGCCAALRDADLRGSGKRIQAPTLVLVGAEDRATTPAEAEALRAAIRGARLAVIPHAAHLPVVERASEVNGSLVEFLGAPLEPPAGEDELFERGMSTRRAVLGRAHVERAERATTELDRDFQAFLTRMAWGSVWSRPGLERRTRSLLTIALLVALGHDEELAIHLRACRNTGVTEREVSEVLLHAAVYAGIPAANRAFRVAKQVLGEAEHVE